jgi:hypothetical protein
MKSPLLLRIAWMRQFIHNQPETAQVVERFNEMAMQSVGRLLPAAALDVFQAGLPRFCLLAFGFRDDESAAA